MPSRDISYFANTRFRGRGVPFGVRTADRLMHIYAVGQTGVGKSTLLETLASQDIAAGRGFAVFDPHGDLIERLHRRCAYDSRVIIVDAADPQNPYGYNPLRRVPDALIPLAAAGLSETLRKLWPDAWGVRMEHILRNCLYALLEQDGSTLPDILQMFTDKNYRATLAKAVRNPVVRTFWEGEFESYSPRWRAEAVAPVQNKLGALLADPRLYRMLVEPEIDLRFRAIMDEGRVLLVNLSRGRLGEDATRVLGGLMVSTLGLAAFSRAGLPPVARRPFFVHLDEFQSFTTLSMVNMMAELRKYGVGLTLVHQHLHQLEDEVRHAVIGNAGSLICFRLGAEDAGFFARELQPKFSAQDLMSLANRHVLLRLMIDGAPSPPFSAEILAPSEALTAGGLMV